MTSPGLSSELGAFQFSGSCFAAYIGAYTEEDGVRLYYCVGIRAIIKKH